MSIISSHIRLETDSTDGVARLVIDRIAKRNAFSLDMWHTLTQVCAELVYRQDIRVVLVHGLGGHFCAGADIDEFSSIRAQAEQAQHYQSVVEQAVHALLALPMPTVAAVEGACIGGGVDILLACDLHIAQDKSRFAVPPARIGLVYTAWEAQLLADAVGRSWAKRLLFTGQTLSSATALRIGLIDELVAQNVYAAALSLGASIANNAILPVRAAKLALSLDAYPGRAATVERMAQTAIRSSDYQEGIRAFLEKRSPQFTGH